MVKKKYPEEEICKDYLNGYSKASICKKYKMGGIAVNKIIDSKGIARTTGTGSRTKELWEKKIIKRKSLNKNGSRDIYHYFYARWKWNANTRNYAFEVTVNDLQKVLESQHYKCAYTGVKLLCPKNLKDKNKTTHSPYLLSLDRIDNKLGYVEGNVHFVCVWVNKAKGAYSHEEFKNIIENLKNKP